MVQATLTGFELFSVGNFRLNFAAILMKIGKISSEVFMATLEKASKTSTREILMPVLDMLLQLYLDIT